MASPRLLLLSRRLIGSTAATAKKSGSFLLSHDKVSSFRFMSSGGGSGGKGDDDDDDLFGLLFDDSDDIGNLGKDIPPNYVRDSMTGKMTGEVANDLTEEENRVLKMDANDEEPYLMEKLMEQANLSDDGSDIATVTKEMRRQALIAKRIRDENMGLNVLGRSVKAVSAKGVDEDGEEVYEDPSGFSKPLSSTEFNVFQKHMQDEYDEFIEEPDIPVEQDGGVLDGFADNDYLNKKWLKSPAVRFMDNSRSDDPFVELMPSDLNPSLFVNRRKSKPIPEKVLHHNNLILLRRFLTPSGTIMNRMHSRLGARDQRRIARLVKRAREVGVIPYGGNFIIEDHGDIHEKDLHKDNEWEKELIRRGLVIKSDFKESSE